MARAGRKRKLGPRFPSGQLKQIQDAEREAGAKQQAVVLAQPHRRGETSQLAGSALGRFILLHRLRREYFDAAEHWATTKRKWLSISGAPMPDRPGGTGGDVPRELYASWVKADADASKAMEQAAGPAALAAVRALSVDDSDLPATYPAALPIKALAALAVHFGYLPANARDVAV